MRGYALIGVLAATLVVPGGYALLGLMLAVLGLANIHQAVKVTAACWQQKSMRYAISGFLIYVACHVVIGVRFQYRVSYYEPLIPLLLIPLMMVGLQVIKPEPKQVWIGMSLGAFFAGISAAFQVFVFEIPRAHGAHGNAIPFGHIALLLSAASACGILYFHRNGCSSRYLVVSWLGILGGFSASLLSGSKGGWFAVFGVTFFLAWQLSSKEESLRRLVALSCGVLVVAGLLVVAPRELVVDRLQGGLNGALLWLSTGSITEGSVSIRLEIWRYGLSLFGEQPLLGWHQTEAVDALRQHLRQFHLNDFLSNLRSFDNQIVEAMVFGGVVGLAGTTGLFVGVFLGFWNLLTNQDEEGAESALAGMMMIVMLAGFGLSVSVLGVNAFRQVLVSWTLLWLSVTYLQKTRQSAV